MRKRRWICCGEKDRAHEMLHSRPSVKILTRVLQPIMAYSVSWLLSYQFVMRQSCAIFTEGCRLWGSSKVRRAGDPKTTTNERSSALVGQLGPTTHADLVLKRSRQSFLHPHMVCILYDNLASEILSCLIVVSVMFSCHVREG